MKYISEIVHNLINNKNDELPKNHLTLPQGFMYGLIIAEKVASLGRDKDANSFFNRKL